MNYLSFAAIVSFFLNVSLTSSLDVMNKTTSQIAFPRNQDTLDEKICYNEFIPRVNYVMAKIKNDTNFCVNGADLKFQIKEKVKQLHGLMAKCSLELNPRKYFTCMKSITADNKKILDEISSITDNFSKQNKTECLIEIFESAKYRSSSAFYDLNLCLKNIHQSNLTTTTTTTTSPKPTEVSSENSDFFSKALVEIKVEYATLKKCVLNGVEFNTCWENVASISVYGQSFKELAEIDKAGDSCIRQFLTIAQNQNYQFDLEGCLRHGYTAVIQSEENEEKDILLIRNLLKFYNTFNGCRVMSKDLSTNDCVSNMFGNDLALEIQREITMKSEGNFEKLTKIIIDLYKEHLPCIGDILPSMQFDSMDLVYGGSNVLQDCLMLGYKLPAVKTDDDILTTLKTIQDKIKTCTLHPDSPGLFRCLRNYHNVYYSFLTPIRNDHYELAVESDATYDTCFRIILKGYCEEENEDEDPKCGELRNCIFNKT